MPAVGAVNGIRWLACMLDGVEMALGAVDADIDLIELDYDVVVTVRANYRLGYFRCGHPNSRNTFS